ncbi:MAG: hypothetical protein ACRC5M_04345 [Anaeroplasmataceae bacterium]
MTTFVYETRDGKEWKYKDGNRVIFTEGPTDYRDGTASVIIPNGPGLLVKGDNSSNRLGLVNGEESLEYDYKSIKELEDVVIRDFYSNSNSSFVISICGDLWACGDNSCGELGLGKDAGDWIGKWTKVEGVTDVIGIGTISYGPCATSFVLTMGGDLYSSGFRYPSINNEINTEKFKLIPNSPPLRSVYINKNVKGTDDGFYAISKDYRLYFYGLEDRFTKIFNNPVQIKYFADIEVEQVAYEADKVYVLASDGRVFVKDIVRLETEELDIENWKELIILNSDNTPMKFDMLYYTTDVSNFAIAKYVSDSEVDPVILGKYGIMRLFDNIEKGLYPNRWDNEFDNEFTLYPIKMGKMYFLSNNEELGCPVYTTISDDLQIKEPLSLKESSSNIMRVL